MTQATEHLRAKIAERKLVAAIPGDALTALLLWEDKNPPPVIPIVCRVCGKKAREFTLPWSEAEMELDRHGALPVQITGFCRRHEPEDSDNDDEEG